MSMLNNTREANLTKLHDQDLAIKNINWSASWNVAEKHVLGEYRTVFTFTLGCFVLVSATVLGTLSNLIALRYFFTKNNIFFNALKIVAISDLAICHLSTFYGMCLIAERAPLLFTYEAFCWAWNLLWKLLTRFSLHMVAIQSMLRAIKICRPFQIISNSVLWLVVAADLLLIIGLMSANRNISEPIYTKTYASCVEQRETDHIDLGLWRYLAALYLILPFPVILGCCILCIAKLIMQNLKIRGKSGRKKLPENRKHSIISLLAFSVTGLVLNILPILPVLSRVEWYEGIENESNKFLVWMMLYGHVIFRLVSVSLNSTINPYIFHWRMTDFQSYVSFNITRRISTSRTSKKTRLSAKSRDRSSLQRGQTTKMPTQNQNIVTLNAVILNNTLHHVSGDKLENTPSPAPPDEDSTSELAGNVIVHRAVVDQTEEELHVEDTIDEIKCNCECCFFDANNVTEDIGYDWTSHSVNDIAVYV